MASLPNNARDRSAVLQASCMHYERSVELCRSARQLVQRNRQNISARRARIEALAARRLRRSIDWRITQGLLPAVVPARTIGMRGEGELCDICDRPVTPSQLMMSIAWNSTGAHLHADCYMMWRAQVYLRVRVFSAPDTDQQVACGSRPSTMYAIPHT
jgi:hypothetical protein